MARIVRTYQATIKIAYNNKDEDIDIEDIVSGYHDWISTTLMNDNSWGSGSVEVNLTDWKELVKSPLKPRRQ